MCSDQDPHQCSHFLSNCSLSDVYPDSLLTSSFIVQTGPPKQRIVTLAHNYFSFFLLLLVSLKLEHYTRECEFRNFDIIKKQRKKTKQHKKKHKNLWLNFCLNKECPKLLCGLSIGHRRRQTIPMRNSSGEKGILQGITVCLVSAVLSTM